MGIFAQRAEAATPTGSEARVDLPETLLAHLPAGFAAVGEALASGAGTVDVCAVTGRELGLEGVSLDEALEALQETSRLVCGAPPEFADTRALALGWSEATLDYLHRLTCADPVTGLASLAHLQSRLSELYRGQLRGRPAVRTSYALVVVDGGETAPADGHLQGSAEEHTTDAFVGDLRAARLAEATRTVFDGDETVGRVGSQRLVVIARRDALLAQRVALVRSLLPADAGRLRTWLEGLPDDAEAAASVLGELVRA